MDILQFYAYIKLFGRICRIINDRLVKIIALGRTDGIGGRPGLRQSTELAQTRWLQTVSCVGHQRAFVITHG